VEALGTIGSYELTYGYRRITHLLRRRGVYRNYKCIYRHLKALGQLQSRKRKGRSHQVLSSWKPQACNLRWEADLVVVPCGIDGQAYGIAFIDCFDKEVIGQVFSQRCRAEEVESALWSTIFQRFPNGLPRERGIELVLRVDRGGQFIARRIREVIRRLFLHLEVCGVQRPNGKPYIESFVSHYKTEEVYRNCYTDFQEAKAGWLNYIQWHNTQRLHSALGYRTVKEVAPAPILWPLGVTLPDRSQIKFELSENGICNLSCQEKSYKTTPPFSPV